MPVYLLTYLLVLYRCGRRLTETNEQNVTLIMIIVVLVFMICHVPAKMVQIVWSYRRQSCATPEFFVRELSVVFELLASSLNFLNTSPSPGLTRVPLTLTRADTCPFTLTGADLCLSHPHGGSHVSVSPSPGLTRVSRLRPVSCSGPMRRIAQLPHLLRLSAPISTTLHRRGVVCAQNRPSGRPSHVTGSKTSSNMARLPSRDCTRGSLTSFAVIR